MKTWEELDALLDQSEHDLNRAVDRFVVNEALSLQSERGRRAEAKLAEAGIAFDRKGPPEEGTDAWFYWREVERIQTALTTGGMQRVWESNGGQACRLWRIKDCGYRDWRLDVLDLERVVRARLARSRDDGKPGRKPTWLYREIADRLNKIGERKIKELRALGPKYAGRRFDPLNNRGIERILDTVDDWLPEANRQGSSHLATAPP